MANLKIEGNGICFYTNHLDDEITESYSNLGEIPKSKHDELENEAEISCFGFFANSKVILNGEEIATVESLIEQSKESDKYQNLHDALSESLDTGLISGWSNEQSLSGCFIDIHFPDYPSEADGSIGKEFIAEFIKNLYVVNGNVFNLLGWEENTFEIDIESLIKQNNYFLYHDENACKYTITSD